MSDARRVAAAWISAGGLLQELIQFFKEMRDYDRAQRNQK